MATIFISYRRADSASETGRLYDRLVERYGRAQVFKDVDSIPAGVDFPDYIAESIQASDVALVVIGPRWLGASSGFAQRRLDGPADFVRIEIETALRLGVPVIPVLVGGASLPSARRLPESLRPLLRQNGLGLRQDPDFSRDVERIFAAIDYWAAQPRRPLPPAPETSVRAPTAAAERAAQPEAPGAMRVGPARVAVASKPPTRPSSARRLPMLRRAPLLAASSALLVIAVVVTAFALSQHPGGASSLSAADRQDTQIATAARATQTAEVNRANQPYRPTGIGPCDTNPNHQYAYGNPFYWQIWAPTLIACQSDGVTARVRGGSVGNQSPIITFWGTPQYAVNSGNGFPTNFMLTMDVTFTGTDPHGYNNQYCAVVAVEAEEPANTVTSLVFCRDGSFIVQSGQSAGVSHLYTVSEPNHIAITVKNQQMKMTLNQAPFYSQSPRLGTIDAVLMSSQAPPGDDITISNFVLAPITA